MCLWVQQRKLIEIAAAKLLWPSCSNVKLLMLEKTFFVEMLLEQEDLDMLAHVRMSDEAFI